MNENLPEDFAVLCDLRSTRPGPLTSETLRLLKMSVAQKKYAIYRDISGLPRGYVAWADVNIESLLRIGRTGNFPRYIYEWDEGDIRLVLDVLMHARPGAPSLASIMSELATDAAMVAFVRRARLRIYQKENGVFRLRPADPSGSAGLRETG